MNKKILAAEQAVFENGEDFKTSGSFFQNKMKELQLAHEQSHAALGSGDEAFEESSETEKSLLELEVIADKPNTSDSSAETIIHQEDSVEHIGEVDGEPLFPTDIIIRGKEEFKKEIDNGHIYSCLLYTSDAADE